MLTDEGDYALNPVGDLQWGIENDITPTQVMDQESWTKSQRRQLRDFASRLEALAGTDKDQKLYAASIMLEEWLSQGFHPVVFCRYIETANYLGEYLQPQLLKKNPALKLQVVTSEEPDELRRQRIEEMAGDHPRILIATDCLSEGINLQDLFTRCPPLRFAWKPEPSGATRGTGRSFRSAGPRGEGLSPLRCRQPHRRYRARCIATQGA